MAEGAADKQSNAEPFVFRAPLTVCVDVTHPLCYLALEPVRTLAGELDIEVDWLPFPAPAASRPADPAPGSIESRGARHRRIRARYQEAELLRYAAVQGLTIRGLNRAPDGTLACLGLLWLNHRAPGRGADCLQRLCAGYWSEALDLEDPDSIGAVLASLDQDAREFAAFAAGPGPAELARLRDRLVASGVFAVPALVVENEVFLGRAHLPLVRWRLTGRSGPAPV